MGQTSTRPIIDAWAQPILKDGVLPEVVRLFEQSGSAYLLGRDLSAAPLVELMDQAGVERVLLCAWHRTGTWVISNDTIAEFVRRFPQRFIGVAAVNLEKPVEAVRELERAVKDLGFKALRVVPWLWNRPPNDKFYFPLYVKCIELDIPFCTQVGHTGPLMPSEPGRPVPYLDEVALTFPDLRIVAGHIGYPWTDEIIGVAWKHANVFIDTSVHAPRYYPQQLVHYLKTYGQDKVLFGTNFPQLSWETCVQQVEAMDLPEEVQRSFWGETRAGSFDSTEAGGMPWQKPLLRGRAPVLAEQGATSKGEISTKPSQGNTTIDYNQGGDIVAGKEGKKQGPRRGKLLTTGNDQPAASLAEVHILFHGYAREGDAPAVSRVASTVAFVREGDVRVIIDPGMLPDPALLLEALHALGESPASITDVIFSHHHPDHTLNAALFPHARFHDHWAIYQGDTWTDRPAEGYELAPSIRLIETPGHTPQDITTLVGTPQGIVAFTHLWWSAQGPTEDPLASDLAALHQNRARVLEVAALIVPGHGAPFPPSKSTPR